MPLTWFLLMLITYIATVRYMCQETNIDTLLLTKL